MARISVNKYRLFGFIGLSGFILLCLGILGTPGREQDRDLVEKIALISRNIRAPGSFPCNEKPCSKSKQDVLDILKIVTYHIEKSDSSKDQGIYPSNLYDTILTHCKSPHNESNPNRSSLFYINLLDKLCQIVYSSSSSENSSICDNSRTSKPKPTFHEEISISKVSVVSDKNLSDSYFKPRSEVINKDYKFLLHNVSLCSLPGGTRPFLLALVPSVIDNRDTRMTIRTTWGSLAYNEGEWAGASVKETMRIVFIFGSDSSLNSTAMKSLSDEAQKFGDILVADFEDSYGNLSLKMAVGISWVDTFCHGVNHVIKVDEDTFVHVPKLVQLLKTLEKNYSGYVLGYRHWDDEPEVVRDGKWAVGPEYPLKKFPAYLYGYSYVISGPAIKRLRYSYQHMPLVPNEDAYVTGILSKAANLTRLGFPLFASQGANAPICDISRGKYITVTECCDEHHIVIYGNIKNEHRSCLKLREIKPYQCRFNG